MSSWMRRKSIGKVVSTAWSWGRMVGHRISVAREASFGRFPVCAGEKFLSRWTTRSIAGRWCVRVDTICIATLLFDVWKDHLSGTEHAWGVLRRMAREIGSKTRVDSATLECDTRSGNSSKIRHDRFAAGVHAVWTRGCQTGGKGFSSQLRCISTAYWWHCVTSGLE